VNKGDERKIGNEKGVPMDGTNGLKEATHMTAPITSNTLGVNVFTAPGKAMVGSRG
jgi:hypothetical protein